MMRVEVANDETSVELQSLFKKVGKTQDCLLVRSEASVVVDVDDEKI